MQGGGAGDAELQKACAGLRAPCCLGCPLSLRLRQSSLPTFPPLGVLGACFAGAPRFPLLSVDTHPPAAHSCPTQSSRFTTTGEAQRAHGHRTGERHPRRPAPSKSTQSANVAVSGTFHSRGTAGRPQRSNLLLHILSARPFG